MGAVQHTNNHPSLRNTVTIRAAVTDRLQGDVDYHYALLRCHRNRRQEPQSLCVKHVLSAILRSTTLNEMFKSSLECTVLPVAYWASNTHGTRMSPGSRAVGAFPGNPVCSLPGSKRSRVIITPSSSRKRKY